MIEIPDYEIKEILGSGGMATVYLAIHKRLQREVALKVMSSEVSVTEAFQKSFRTEGRTVAKLEHPNIVKIYDIDSQNGHFYMSMELLSKGSLKELISNEKISVTSALNIIEQISNALSYAHQKGYIHRDIKPANIMFREDGSAVLTDFGIAKMQGTTGEMTQMGFIAGTPYYMAPEQVTGSNEVDQRADIYSLGVMFYEMLTGSKPFTGSNTVAITYDHVHGNIPTLHGEQEIFQSAINKALAKNPEERFDTAEDFSKALYQASQLQDETIIFDSSSLSEAETLIIKTNSTLSKDNAKKKVVWPWLVVILIIVIIGFLGVSYIKNKEEITRLDMIEKQAKLDMIEKDKRVEEIKKNKEIEKEKKADELRISLEIEKEKKAEEIRRIREIEKEKELILTEKIENLLSLAIIKNEKRKTFDHTEWSKGCRDFLEDIDGPYDPKDTSEFYLQKILSLDKSNTNALEAIAIVNKRKTLEFKNCDSYLRPEVEDPLKDLFN